MYDVRLLQSTDVIFIYNSPFPCIAYEILVTGMQCIWASKNMRIYFLRPSGICLFFHRSKMSRCRKASTKWLKLNRNSEWAEESRLFPIFCSNDVSSTSSSWKMWLQHIYLYTVTPSAKAIPHISCNNCNAIERIEYAMHVLHIYFDRHTLLYSEDCGCIPIAALFHEFI